VKNLVEKWKSKVDDRNKKAKKVNVKTQKMQMTFAFQVEYEAPVDLYESKDPNKMAEQDMEYIKENPIEVLKVFSAYPGSKVKWKVTPVLTTGQKAGLEIE